MNVPQATNVAATESCLGDKRLVFRVPKRLCESFESRKTWWGEFRFIRFLCYFFGYLSWCPEKAVLTKPWGIPQLRSVQTLFTNLQVQIIKFIWAFEVCVFFFGDPGEDSSLFVNNTFAGKKTARWRDWHWNFWWEYAVEFLQFFSETFENASHGLRCFRMFSLESTCCLSSMIADSYPPWNEQFALENSPGPKRKFHLPTLDFQGRAVNFGEGTAMYLAKWKKFHFTNPGISLEISGISGSLVTFWGHRFILC